MVMSMISLSDPGRGLEGVDEVSEGREIIDEEKEASKIWGVILLNQSLTDSPFGEFVLNLENEHSPN